VSQKTTLDIQDYLDAASDASIRTRTVSLVLVVASVLVFAALLNSLQSSWMLGRMRLLQNPYSEYVISRIGCPPDQEGAELEEYKQRYADLRQAFTKSYVENTFYVRVPFFGFTFDINDLGLLGGLAFLILLILLRFCLSREITNIVLSFSEADRTKPSQLKDLYILLAMQQVFTVPRTTQAGVSRFLWVMPKILCFLPLTVHIAVSFHDMVTMGLFITEFPFHILAILITEAILAVCIFFVTRMAVTLLMHIDLIWKDCWKAIQEHQHYHAEDYEWKKIVQEWKKLCYEETRGKDIMWRAAVLVVVRVLGVR
jgi:hypothetical protein